MSRLVEGWALVTWGRPGDMASEWPASQQTILTVSGDYYFNCR